MELTMSILAILLVSNLIMVYKLAAIKKKARVIARQAECCTLIAEAIRFVGEISGEPVWAYDPIGLRRKVVIERGCGSKEVFVES